MSEWWTYGPSDFLLFSPRTYYRLFELYNREIWPAQVVSLGVGLAMLALLRRRGIQPGRVVAAMLAGCWLWVAWVFHFQRYATINWAATYFALAFVVEALLLISTGIVGGRLTFQPGHDAAQRTGLGVVAFAIGVMPLIAPLAGRSWVQAEVFGVAPDPTAIATLGVLLAAERPLWGLLAIPLLWCALSGATLWAMGSPETLTQLLVSLLVLLLAVRKTASLRKERAP